MTNYIQFKTILNAHDARDVNHVFCNVLKNIGLMQRNGLDFNAATKIDRVNHFLKEIIIKNTCKRCCDVNASKYICNNTIVYVQDDKFVKIIGFDDTAMN